MYLIVIMKTKLKKKELNRLRRRRLNHGTVVILPLTTIPTLPYSSPDVVLISVFHNSLQLHTFCNCFSLSMGDDRNHSNPCTVTSCITFTPLLFLYISFDMFSYPFYFRFLIFLICYLAMWQCL